MSFLTTIHSSLSTARFRLFLISAILFALQLTCIRWFPAHVVYLTFFTNLVLLACFVGMSLGCLTAKSPRNHILLTPLWLTLAMGLALLCSYESDFLAYHIVVGNNQDSPEMVYFGTETGAWGGTRIPVELFGGIFFLLVALIHLGPGQELGRAFNAVSDRTQAYSVNLAGGIAGILFFALAAYLERSPPHWIIPITAGLYWLIHLRPPEMTFPKRSRWLASLGLPMIILLSVPTSGHWFGNKVETSWSPYYRVNYEPAWKFISTNLVGHQQMLSQESVVPAYVLPYMLRRDLNFPPLRNILIIGAGSGNDLSRALLWADANAQIDAVEIDPVIQQLGEKHHPERPYEDSRVKVHLGDGRNHLRRFAEETPGKYDLIVFALVDSLVLHSGHSNLRLESYLFTKECFVDVHRCLKPDGWCVVSNYFRQGWIIARLHQLLRNEFSFEPLILTSPPMTQIDADAGINHGFTIFIGGQKEGLRRLTAKFEFVADADTCYVPRKGPLTPRSTPDSFEPIVDAEQKQNGAWKSNFTELRRSAIIPSPNPVQIPTDDWPFLYLREPTIPRLTWNGLGIMAGTTLLLFLLLRDRSLPSVTRSAFDGRMFFLGAGFMLIETGAIVQMALVFGSSWQVNVFVFLAILILGLITNLISAKIRIGSPRLIYLGLFSVVACNLLIPLKTFLGLPLLAQALGASLLVFSPLIFAGLIFARSFAESVEPDRAYGSNILGALLGGCSENASMVLGFRNLLIVAAIFYLLSVFRKKSLIRPPSGDRKSL